MVFPFRRPLYQPLETLRDALDLGSLATISDGSMFPSPQTHLWDVFSKISKGYNLLHTLNLSLFSSVPKLGSNSPR